VVIRQANITNSRNILFTIQSKNTKVVQTTRALLCEDSHRKKMDAAIKLWDFRVTQKY
jgi:hypothetical protein